MSQPAVILLIFANDESQPLNELAKELDSLRSSLRSGLKKYIDAQGRKQFEVITLSYSNIERLFDELRIYRNRIAILHFAGHTNSTLWQLNDEILYAKGIADILKLQQSLKFLFLNGCENEQQVHSFAKAGVPALIATSAPINDQKARSFSTHFYQHLINGNLDTRLDEAFALAKAEVNRNNVNEHYRTLRYKKSNIKQEWAWALEENVPRATQWTLGHLFQDDCFGLPALSKNIPLPTRPFKDIYYFSKKDAPIFFGRCKEIVKAYNAVTETYYDTDPVHLLYGNTGVGKSSFIAAGLIPRLEVDGYQTIYYRYDGKVGIDNILSQVLGGQDFLKSWLQKEKEENKPLIIFLDQLESLFTYHFLEDTESTDSTVEELQQLLEAIKTIFYNAEQEQPKGKIVLSFRKEWLAEVLSCFEKKDIPYSKIILETLKSNGIIEAIEGITKDIQTQQRYKLSIDNPENISLAKVMAGDLLKYKQGIAPTLQILLSKMWREVEMQEHPTFNLALYKRLGQKGELIEQHLQDQISEIGNIDPWGHEAKESGLVLDILYAHTTSLGTAGELSVAELERCYAHIPYRRKLLRQLKKSFLIIEIQNNRNHKNNVTRLTHDTLAPLIRDCFDRSTLDGQRAWRILNNRNIGKGYKIGKYDLKIIIKGRYATRKWTESECTLIKKSKYRRILRLSSFALLTIIFVFLGIFSAFQWEKSVKSEQEMSQAKNHLEGLIKTVVLQIQHDLDTSDTALALDIHSKIENYIKVYRDFEFLESLNSRLKGDIFYSTLETRKSLVAFNKSLHLLKKRLQIHPGDLAAKEELIVTYEALARHYKDMIYKNISDSGKVKYLNVFIEMNEQAKQQVLELMQINIDSQEQLRWVYKLFWIKNDIVDGYHYIKNYSKQENLEIPVDYNYEKLLQEIEDKYDFFSLNDSYQSYLSLNARLKYSMANHLTDQSDFEQAIDIYKNISDMLEKAITLKPKDISYKTRQIKALYKVSISYEAIQDYDNALNYIEKTIARLESLKRHGLLPKRVEIWLKKDIKLQRKYEKKIIEATHIVD